jgi:predicted RNase H-like nuclease
VAGIVEGFMRRNAMKIIGIDGCRAGWFAVISNSNMTYEFGIFNNIANIWDKHSDVSLILIDIPIGLIDNGTEERKSDKASRKVLGHGRASSVFVTPCRAAIYSTDYTSASDINYKNTGRRLAKQTWGIVPKIKELDEFLINTPSARSVIKESHPEVGFWALNNNCPMRNPKKKNEGLLERLDVLRHHLQLVDEIYQAALNKYPRSQLAKDDILDAICLMINGVLGMEYEIAILPPAPLIDNVGLPMQMVYCDKLYL